MTSARDLPPQFRRALLPWSILLAITVIVGVIAPSWLGWCMAFGAAITALLGVTLLFNIAGVGGTFPGWRARSDLGLYQLLFSLIPRLVGGGLVLISVALIVALIDTNKI